MAPTRARECGSKQRLTKEAAQARVRYFRDTQASRMHAYRCRWCGNWHVGHWRNDKSRRARR